ncbi:hypothetical protein ABT112_04295 [Streptomyces sp. NPDC002055]|uniref:hypothetical protein n=1 Tax=Streptomyces sp. NPDC002055 TaxID=3154534 RepID=UPI00332401AF
MRKLRKAALVAAMVGSVSMLGGTVASAHDAHKSHKHRDADVVDVNYCNQRSENHNETSQNGLVNLSNTPITLLGSGPSEATATQQICGDKNWRNDIEADTDSGDADGELNLGLPL